MSLAKLNVTEKSRKEFECGGCRETIPKGSRIVRFTVGFRGRPQTRHYDDDHKACYPKPSERESSAVADIYAAQEGFDVSTCTSREEIDEAMDDVKTSCDEVIQQYSDNPMFDNSDDLQERVQTIESARDELDSWADGLSDEPEHGHEDEAECNDDCPSEQEVDDWLDEAREAASGAINDMELP